MSRTGPPKVSIVSRQRSVAYGHSRLLDLVTKALPLCLEVDGALGGSLGSLSHIEFTVLGPRAMARVHRQFLGIRGATDVITFPHGEILVCATVAAERAMEFHHDITTELALYCIHGLLHLSGHDDLTASDATHMSAKQEEILRKVL